MVRLMVMVLVAGCGGSKHTVDAMRDTTSDTAAAPPWSQQAYVKAAKPSGGQFGSCVALSADGSTLAVGAKSDGGGAMGAVYVFSRTGTTWSQQAYLTASNPDNGDALGAACALSGDGSTLAAGAADESSAATGIDGNQADNSAQMSGAVYVFARTGATWSQQAYIKASNTDANDVFGTAVALSGDGSTLAVGAPGESSSATGIDGNQTDNSLGAAGATYVFTRAGATWSQQAYIKASNTDQFDAFGNRVALSADGTTLAVAATHESSAATGVGGDQSDNSIFGVGAVYVFTRGAAWSQQAYLKAAHAGRMYNFGSSVSLSGDGSTLAAGAWGDSTAAESSGAAGVFARVGTTWTAQADLEASNPDVDDFFGASVSLADNGVLVVGASEEASSATGIDGDQSDNSIPHAGASYTFTRAGTAWTQQAYVKASNTAPAQFGGPEFGFSVALAGDGSTMAVGAGNEDSNATGINGNQTDHSSASSGAVYVFVAQ